MTRGVFWDSSAILALLDADDADPRAGRGRRETDRGREAALVREWLFTGGLSVVRAMPRDEQRAKELLARYTDKDWTLCDAVSFAVLHSRRVKRAFTFDHHFRQCGRLEILGLPS